MTDTININETVAQLEGLYNGYNTILKDAKDQLAELDTNLTPEQIDQVAAKIAAQPSLIDSVATNVRFNITTEVGQLDDAIIEQIATALQSKMEERYLQVTREAIEQKIQQVLEDGLLERVIEQRLKQSEEMNAFIDVVAAMSRVVNGVDRIQEMNKSQSAN